MRHETPSAEVLAHETPRRSMIAPRPRCPRCEYPQHTIDMDAGAGWMRCERSHCRATAYVLAVPPGAPIPTLAPALAINAPRVVTILATPHERRILRGQPAARVLAVLGYDTDADTNTPTATEAA